MEENLLHGRFQMLPSCKSFYEVSVTRQNVMFREEVSSSNKRSNMSFTSILLDNVIGSKMFESKIKNDPSCYFQISSMPKNKKGIRQKQNFTFRVSESSDKQENLTIAETWSRTIAWILKEPTISSESLQEKETFPPQKKFYIIINPKSGPGKSLQLFGDVIEPLLQTANIKYETLVTEYAGHCKEKVVMFDCTVWDAVIICSGDGLAYEYINGIMHRPDWEQCLQLPIGILPTGSGNALSASILHSAKEVQSLLNAVFINLKGVSHPMDLFSVENSKRRIFGFLSLSWGIISDIDIESEKYRYLGVARFTLGALKRILKLRHYKGKFSFCLDKGSDTLEQGMDVCVANSSENISSGSGALNAELNNVESTVSSEGGAIDCNTNSDKLRSNGTINSGKTDQIGGDQLYGPPSKLPALNEDVPANWSVIEDEFVTVGVTSLSHLGTDMYSSPKSFFNDGLLNVQMIRKGLTKKRLLNIFTAFEHGKHLEFDEVEELVATRFRLEPSLDGLMGNVAVDGELVEYERLQGEIYPSLANVLMFPTETSSRNYEIDMVKSPYET